MTSRCTLLRIQTLNGLARALDLSPEFIEELAPRAEEFYRPKLEPKSDGSMRVIDRPIAPLKAIQKTIYRRLLRNIQASPIAHGGVPGRSHVSAARSHVNKPIVATVDVKNCFSSVSSHRVYQLFIALGCSPDVARILTRLLTFQGHLPHGSPASTAVLNLLLRNVDDVLSAMQADVTRVVDDYAISGTASAVEAAVAVAIRGINRRSLRINRKKTSFRGRGQRQSVCNLVVNREVRIPNRPSLNAKSNRVRMTLSVHYLRSELRRGRRFGFSGGQRKTIQGRIAYLSQTQPEIAAKFSEILRLIPP